MLTGKSNFGDVGFNLGDEEEGDDYEAPKLKLRGFGLDEETRKRLDEDAEDDGMTELLNSQLNHVVSKITIKKGYTNAQLRGSNEDANEWLDIKRQANSNYMNDSLKFQGSVLEKPL